MPVAYSALHATDKRTVNYVAQQVHGMTFGANKLREDPLHEQSPLPFILWEIYEKLKKKNPFHNNWI